jgi:hypothetical protein
VIVVWIGGDGLILLENDPELILKWSTTQMGIKVQCAVMEEDVWLLCQKIKK